MNLEKIRADFPMLQGELCYLDNAATTQKPWAVLRRTQEFYEKENANIYRGNYALSRNAEEKYRRARKRIERFLDGEGLGNVIFVRNATEAVNLAALSFGSSFLREGDNIVVTEMEHHSNLLPWKELCKRKRCELRIARCAEDGSLPLDSVRKLLDGRTRLTAVTAMSNVTGARPELSGIVEAAHRQGAAVLVDGTQETAHHPVSLRKMECDFFCFSGHKLYGPMGTGGLFVREKYQNPAFFGGGMVEEVEEESTRYLEGPEGLEAGTPDVAGALGLEAAVGYLEALGTEEIETQERKLSEYLRHELEKIRGIRILGPKEQISPVLSFTAEGLSAYDTGVLLGMENIAVRTGKHCAHPYMKRLGAENACRVSLGLYNTKEEIGRLCEALKRIAGRGGRG